MGKMAYANASFLWSFNRASFCLPEDATDEELKEATTQYVKSIMDEIGYATGNYCDNIEVIVK